MRRAFPALLTAAVLTILPVEAGAQHTGFLKGFSGVTFGDPRSDVLVGGGLGVRLVDNVEVVGEVGYMRNTRPATLLGDVLDIGLALAGIEYTTPAWYGEGGVRLLTSSRAPAAGYFEATGGFARLSTRINLNDVIPGQEILDRILDRFSTTKPLLGVGGGIVLRPGPLLLDFGYRYKRIYTTEPLNVNQVRADVGINF